MRPWKKLFVAIVVLLLVPFASNGATLIIEKVTNYADGTPIPEELVNTIKYRYYYGESFSGPFVEGTMTIDNLTVSNLPESSPGIPSTGTGSFPVPGVPYYYTVDSEAEGIKSLKAEPQTVVKIPTPTPPSSGKSSGCSMVERS
jgi:hypothetical protein